MTDDQPVAGWNVAGWRGKLLSAALARSSRSTQVAGRQ
jgi:hypothetical protein